MEEETLTLSLMEEETLTVFNGGRNIDTVLMEEETLTVFIIDYPGLHYLY